MAMPWPLSAATIASWDRFEMHAVVFGGRFSHAFQPCIPFHGGWGVVPCTGVAQHSVGGDVVHAADLRMALEEVLVRRREPAIRSKSDPHADPSSDPGQADAYLYAAHTHADAFEAVELTVNAHRNAFLCGSRSRSPMRGVSANMANDGEQLRLSGASFRIWVCRSLSTA